MTQGADVPMGDAMDVDIKPLAERLREALDRGAFDGVMHDAARETPLSAELGAGWMLLSRVERGTMVALHRASGVWSEIAFEDSLIPDHARILASALNQAASRPDPKGGRYMVHVRSERQAGDWGGVRAVAIHELET